METTHTSQQLMAFLKLLDAKKMTHDRFTSLLGSGILADVLDSDADLDNREAVRTALNLGVLVSDIFRFTVDYNQSLEVMIAAGQYDWKSDDITAKRFSIEGSGIVECEAHYFHFNCSIFSKNAIKGIKATDSGNPWMPAKIEHMLSHGKTFPEEQRKFQIIGLGSVAEVGRYRRVPVLYGDDSGRELRMDWFDGRWAPVCRFLAVRKVSGH